MEQIILSLLTNNSYLDINRELLNLQLLSHPDYPSLKAITDTLDYFEIENRTWKNKQNRISAEIIGFSKKIWSRTGRFLPGFVLFLATSMIMSPKGSGLNSKCEP